MMKRLPDEIEVIKEGATFNLPSYIVTNDGIVDGNGVELLFCKGSVEDDTAFRQEGVFTESLLEAVVQYLETVNVGDLASRETSLAITNIQQGIFWLQKRAKKRKLKGVQGTYKK